MRGVLVEQQDPVDVRAAPVIQICALKLLDPHSCVHALERDHFGTQAEQLDQFCTAEARWLLLSRQAVVFAYSPRSLKVRVLIQDAILLLDLAQLLDRM